MGFKKTSEGRVFFQGTDENESGHGRGISAGPANVPAGMQAGSMSSAQMQTQIVTLLKTLNERLKATQADRNKMAKELEAYRALLEDLEQKSARSERAYMELERRIAAGGGNAGGASKAEAIAKEALRELQETRKMMLELEDKTERADRGVAGLKNEILETRKVSNQLIGKQTSLEKFSLEQAEKIAENATSFSALIGRIKDTEQKQQDLSDKIELTTQEQGRLLRKLDKAVEDRVRFMRKIERIEEAVIHTRESLNAKAMVLLTDQGASASSGLGIDPATDELSAQLAALQAQTGAIGGQERSHEMAYMRNLPWWRKPYRMQAVGLGVVVITALLGGWAISEMQKPVLPDFDFGVSSQLTAEEQTTTPPATENADAAPAIETTTPAAEEQPLDMAGMDWTVPDQSAADAQAEADASQQSAALTSTPLSHDDIGALDLSKQEEVEKLLGVDSESAATALNTIEPSTPVPATQRETIAPLKTEPFKVDQATLKNPKDLIKPDTTLPDVVKQIEAKAFESVPEAQHDLAAVYTAGHGGVKQDYKRAAFWFEQAADRGIANAAYNLGVLYHQGLGVKANLETALDWYRKAATMGHPEAQYNLGIAYIEGIGVGYDPVKAAQYFKSAADQDIMEAAYNLGLIYENGLLGNAKPDEALMWYKTAADKGSPEARQALEQLAKSLNIKLEDVNRLAESMKVIKKSDAAPVTRPALAPPEKHADVDNDPVNADTSLQAITAQVQEYLVRMGLFPGPADGVMGPVTGDAIRSYQKMHGLNPDGLVTQGLLTHMLASATPTDQEGGLEEGSREF